MFGELALGVWSGLGLGWWIFAWRLVVQNSRREAVVEILAERKSLSIFKPLPLLGGRGLQNEAAGLESFIAQLDADSELLLGVHEADRAATASFIEGVKSRYPQARVKIVFRSTPDEVANPKVAWQKILASEATGELWLWSDSDIVTPRGFLDSMRTEFERSDAAMLTFPYVVRGLVSGPVVFDALYVNVEFYPGVLLLRGRGQVDFGLGAGMLFRRDDFLRAVDWDDLGSALADDFALGQKLQPVRISETTLVTAADVTTWGEAVLHHLRWTKTVWWNRPAGSAARVVVMPVLGWVVYVVLNPGSAEAWAGFLLMMQIDVLFAALICRAIGCEWRVRNLLATEVWSLGRVGAWMACWFPWPVTWRGATWWGPRKKLNSNEQFPQ